MTELQDCQVKPSSGGFSGMACNYDLADGGAGT